ncbi:Hypothetical protein UVM_LOCUS107 [uncultured virus]|nr:Hypothetical protein UVM_LOCUS107 [uncultured virus]
MDAWNAIRPPVLSEFVRADVRTYEQLMDIVLPKSPLEEIGADMPEVWQFAASDGALSLLIGVGADDGEYPVYARHDTGGRIDRLLISFTPESTKSVPHEFRPFGRIDLDTGLVLLTSVPTPTAAPASGALAVPSSRSRDGHLVAARFLGGRRPPFHMLGKVDRVLILLDERTDATLPPRYEPVGRVTTPNGWLLITDPVYVLPARAREAVKS